MTAIADATALGACVGRDSPSHVIVRLRGGKEDGAVLDAVRDLAAASGPAVTVIADDASMRARIEAVRAGVEAYLTPPLDALGLVERLESLKRGVRADPYRVMIVDDDVTMAKYYDAVLRAAGMQVMVLNDPMKVIRYLADFRPELILMDHYMPEIQGRELAAVIRQEAAFDSIPIVFLSAEDDATIQQRVMGIGGDDFLTKSIRADNLVSAVANRARRFRALRATMLRDSLTGLLNHTAMKERLAADLARMKRTDRPLTLCILDLDHFKLVNDTYGHPAGDRVLRALAHLLKQRLRVSDVIGRYGGEEFAIALPDTSVEQALPVLDEIRVAFAEMPQHHEGGTFHVTFSAGLAAFPRSEDSARLTDAADRALYRAKAAGRDRVVPAGAVEYGSRDAMHDHDGMRAL
ncbi:diguanylate cyclase [Marivibrio halodurans]|uniref:GGDEF domain-containing response regulator n=1 Tax=Marivibrio halodurans TaxID=2039722 RepID=UPI00360A4F1C